VAASARTRAWSRRTRGGAPWGHRERAAMEPRAAAPSSRRWDEAATRAAGGVRMWVRRPPAAPAGRGDGERAARTRHRRGTDAYPADFFVVFSILRRVQGVSAHGELIIFAVCLKSWHTANSSRRRQVPVTPSSCFFAPCTSTNTRQRCLPCARNLAHGKLGLCRACSCRRRFAVCNPRRNLRRVPGAHGDVSKSGSDSWMLMKENCVFCRTI